MHESAGYEESEAVTRARLAAIVESSDDVIVSKTLDGIITSWNPTAERVFGWTAAEAIGQHITLIVPDDRRAEEEDVLARLRRGERIDHFDTVRRAKDGRRIDMSITVSPVKDGTGRIVGASKVARDITDRRRFEEQRALLLAHEQVARRRAEALNNAKDELLATVSHELRTPLNAIFGWARLMESGTLDEKGRDRAIGIILRNATAQARLVDDLLDLARIASGSLRLDFDRVDLNAAVEAALETVRPAAHAKDITLVADLDRTVGSIEGASDRLQQVMWNLLLNSVKFTPQGGRVEVASRRTAASVTVSVKDTGQGIAADVLPHVFEPFRQEDSSSTRAQGGLGLGLTLVRRLVELHGGEVVAESAGKGLGSTFTVTLPLPVSRRAPEAQSVPSRTGNGRRVLDGARVIVVDDDPEFLDLTAIVLRRAGAEVRTVSSAARAHEVIEAWRPDVVLTDLAMPGEDGITLGSAIRTIFSESHAKIAIVAVTAYATAESRARATRAGFDLYLTKPVDPAELPSAVAGVLQRPV